MDVIECVAGGAVVNALAAGCPECGADPRTGETKYAPPIPAAATPPQPLLNSVALGLAVAGGFLSLGPFMARLSVVVAPVAIVVGIAALVLSRRAGRPASRAVLAIGIATAALVFALWELGVWDINY